MPISFFRRVSRFWGFSGHLALQQGNPSVYWGATLSCSFTASNYADSYLVPISFWSRSGCWPCLGIIILSDPISFYRRVSRFVVFQAKMAHLCFCLVRIKMPLLTYRRHDQSRSIDTTPFKRSPCRFGAWQTPARCRFRSQTCRSWTWEELADGRGCGRHPSQDNIHTSLRNQKKLETRNPGIGNQTFSKILGFLTTLIPLCMSSMRSGEMSCGFDVASNSFATEFAWRRVICIPLGVRGASTNFHEISRQFSIPENLSKLRFHTRKMAHEFWRILKVGPQTPSDASRVSFHFLSG